MTRAKYDPDLNSIKLSSFFYNAAELSWLIRRVNLGWWLWQNTVVSRGASETFGFIFRTQALKSACQFLVEQYRTIQYYIMKQQLALWLTGLQLRTEFLWYQTHRRMKVLCPRMVKDKNIIKFLIIYFFFQSYFHFLSFSASWASASELQKFRHLLQTA